MTEYGPKQWSLDQNEHRLDNWDKLWRELQAEKRLRHEAARGFDYWHMLYQQVVDEVGRWR